MQSWQTRILGWPASVRNPSMESGLVLRVHDSRHRRRYLAERLTFSSFLGCRAVELEQAAQRHLRWLAELCGLPSRRVRLALTVRSRAYPATPGRTILASRLNGFTLTDPERPEIRWSYSLRNGQLWIERRESADVEQLPIDYAFGSGLHGTTLVTLSDRTPNRLEIIEHRLTAYAHGETLDITPGQEVGSSKEGIVPSGTHLGNAITLKCFNCHTTTTSDRGPLVLDEATMIPNVGCERCHGPGRTHVEAARQGSAEAFLAMPFGLGRWTAGDEIRMCGSCHRLPAFVDHDQIAADNPSSSVSRRSASCSRPVTG